MCAKRGIYFPTIAQLYTQFSVKEWVSMLVMASCKADVLINETAQLAASFWLRVIKAKRENRVPLSAGGGALRVRGDLWLFGGTQIACPGSGQRRQHSGDQGNQRSAYLWMAIDICHKFPRFPSHLRASLALRGYSGDCATKSRTACASTREYCRSAQPMALLMKNSFEPRFSRMISHSKGKSVSFL